MQAATLWCQRLCNCISFIFWNLFWIYLWQCGQSFGCFLMHIFGLVVYFWSLLLKYTGYICQCRFASGGVGGPAIPTGSILHIPEVGVDFRGGAQSKCWSRAENWCSYFDVQVSFLTFSSYAQCGYPLSELGMFALILDFFPF